MHNKHTGNILHQLKTNSALSQEVFSIRIQEDGNINIMFLIIIIVFAQAIDGLQSIPRDSVEKGMR